MAILDGPFIGPLLVAYSLADPFKTTTVGARHLRRLINPGRSVIGYWFCRVSESRFSPYQMPTGERWLRLAAATFLHLIRSKNKP